MTKSRLTVAALAAAALTLAACTTDDTGDDTPGNTDGTDLVVESTPEITTEPATDTTADADPAGHNDADTEFAQMMIPHHEQGVELADLILAKEGTDPRVQDLAQRIRDAQDQETAQMRGWLDVWGAPADTGMDHSDMDGMLDEEQMAEVENASNPEAQRLFLEHMIAHHEGAVDMAENHLDNGQNQEALDLSGQIVNTQEAEIQEMEEILDTL